MPPPPLPLPPQQFRINLSDLKSQIVKRLGPERAHQYFNHLNQLLSQKLSKPEFSKLCISTLGRENVGLHNQLICSILSNAYHAKIPPSVSHDKILAKAVKDGGSSPSLAPLPPVLSNGDILPPSPRKSRSDIRKIKDRPSPLGPNGKVGANAHQALVPSDEVVRENGELNAYGFKRLVQHHEGGSAEQPAKRRRTDRASPGNHDSIHSKNLADLAADEDQEDVVQRDVLKYIRGPLQAPLGIPFCHASVSGTRRRMPINISGGTASFITSYANGELCTAEDLKARMEIIAQGLGLGGVTIDSANLLNHALNAYLKRLICSSVELIKARLGQEPSRQPVYKQQAHGKPLNGVWQGSHLHIQNDFQPMEGAQEQKNHHSISLQDFKVAMELIPHQLGEDWPLIRERICLHSFEE